MNIGQEFEHCNDKRDVITPGSDLETRPEQLL